MGWWRRDGGGGMVEEGWWRRDGGGGMVEEGWWRRDGEEHTILFHTTGLHFSSSN